MTKLDTTTGQREFEGQVAVVTGAAGGIGKATAQLLASRGASIICVDRDSAGTDAVCAEIQQSEAQAFALHGDVSKVETFDRIRDLAQERFGRVDILANVAGVWEVKGFDTMDELSWQLIFDVNVTSVLLSVQTLAPLLRQSDGGRIINVAATDGFRGSTTMPHYAAAKAAVVNLTKSYALELAPSGVLVNCVAPGAIATPRAAQDSWLEERRKTVPLNRLGTANDVAELIVFLASRRNTFTTGATIPANGGLYMP